MGNLSDLKKKSAARAISVTASPFARAAFAAAAIVAAVALCPDSANATVEGSLSAIQQKVVGTLLPLAAICGLSFAGLSFVAGRPNARTHLTLAIIGAIVGFGAESIVALIRSVIQ